MGDDSLSLLSVLRLGCSSSRPPRLPLRSQTMSEGGPLSEKSPPLQKRFSYTSGLPTPRDRRRSQRGHNPSNEASAFTGGFLKLKMPPKKSLPTFVMDSAPASPTQEETHHSCDSAPAGAATAAVRAAERADRPATGVAKVRRRPSPPRDFLMRAAAAAAAAPVATAVLTPVSKTQLAS